MIHRVPPSPPADDWAELAGVKFADPYRWLGVDSQSALRWQAEQDEIAAEYLEDWPGWDGLRTLISDRTADRSAAAPVWASNRWFRVEAAPAGSDQQIVGADEPFGPGVPIAFVGDLGDKRGKPVCTFLSPSPDGRWLVVGVCSDGSEESMIRIVDVASGKRLPEEPPQVLRDSIASRVSWLPDSEGFYFLGSEGGTEDFRQQMLLCRLQDPGRPKKEEIPGVQQSDDYTFIQISPDCRWGVAAHRWMNPIPIAVRDFSDPTSGWKPFLSHPSGTVVGHIVDGAYIAVTDIGAPKGRVVSIPLDAVDPDDSDGWAELVSEGDSVLRWLTPAGDLLYLAELVGTYSRLRVIDRRGVTVSQVPLPGKGSILGSESTQFASLARRSPADQFVFGFSTLTSSWAFYRHRSDADELECLRPPASSTDACVDDRFATAADGASIPYQLVRSEASSRGKPCPTLIFAYGGFNSAFMPQYLGPMLAFVEAGGNLAYTHLRGGGECGREWWEGGRMLSKRNCYSDLYAVAEDLIEAGITSSRELAVMGESNGGLMCGVALLERPDLWKVVIPRFPFLDLIAACGHPFGRWAIAVEYADVDDPDEVRRLATFSPQALVSESTAYPSVYLDVGANDIRCPPWHARKFAARLQNSNSGDTPVLLRLWQNVGHGSATDGELALEQETSWLAFLFKELDMDPQVGSARGH